MNDKQMCALTKPGSCFQARLHTISLQHCSAAADLKQYSSLSVYGRGKTMTRESVLKMGEIFLMTELP